MNALKLYRLRADMTGVELAKVIKVHASYISHIETYNTVAERYAKKIARVLRLEVEDIFEEAGRPGRLRARNINVKVKI